MTLEASPLTPLIKFIEFEISTDATAVKHIAIKGNVGIGIKSVKSTLPNHRPLK